MDINTCTRLIEMTVPSLKKDMRAYLPILSRIFILMPIAYFGVLINRVDQFFPRCLTSLTRQPQSPR